MCLSGTEVPRSDVCRYYLSSTEVTGVYPVPIPIRPHLVLDGHMSTAAGQPPRHHRVCGHHTRGRVRHGAMRVCCGTWPGATAASASAHASTCKWRIQALSIRTDQADRPRPVLLQPPPMPPPASGGNDTSTFQIPRQTDRPRPIFFYSLRPCLHLRVCVA